MNQTQTFKNGRRQSNDMQVLKPKKLKTNITFDDEKPKRVAGASKGLMHLSKPSAFTRKNSEAVKITGFGSGSLFETYNPSLTKLRDKRGSIQTNKSISIIASPNSRAAN